MGDITEMTLEGILCEGCGEFIGEAVGHPRMCKSCRSELNALRPPAKAKTAKKVPCGVCGKLVKKGQGQIDHLRDAHGEQMTQPPKSASIPWKWEQIDPYHTRTKVFGGWLVKSISEVVHNLCSEGRGMDSGWDFREAMAFVPDPNHKWELEVAA